MPNKQGNEEFSPVVQEARMSHAVQIAFLIVFSILPHTCWSASSSNEADAIVGSLWPACKEGKWGYIDGTGAFIVPARFQFAYDFAGDHAAFMVDRKIGFIDRTGKVVLEPQFDEITCFAEGLARVVLSYRSVDSYLVVKRCCFVDLHGKQAFTREFETTYHPTSFAPAAFALVSMPPYPRLFVEGLAAVKEGGKVGYIDKNGNFAIPAIYDSGSDFSEGVAVVRTGERTEIIDTHGIVLAKLPSSMKLVDSSREGLLLVDTGGKRGFISHKGEWVIRPQSEYVSPFSEGLALIAKQTESGGWFGCKKTSKLLVGFMDGSEKTVIQPQFEDTMSSHFSEGLAAVKRIGENKVGYIDKTGGFAIKPQFQSVGPFKNGVARVYVTGHKKDQFLFGYINKQGNFIWKQE